MIKTVIDLSASWCMPCKVFAKTFEEVSKMDDFKDVKFESYDIENDEQGEVYAEKFQVRSVPTIIIVDDKDEIVYKVSGNIAKKDFIQTLDDAKNK